MTDKMLSGSELVSKGATKRTTTLPEKGPKDVLSSGSWLEQKQIQAAIEARKHLLEDERIEKSGSLSHAEWKEPEMKALLTSTTGNFFNFLGHNVGSSKYLEPEEALFLMETNLLLLQYGGITVSIQQAYSLLLRGEIKLPEYKVYASLSRLGYKIIRHREAKQGTSDTSNTLQTPVDLNSSPKDNDELCDRTTVKSSKSTALVRNHNQIGDNTRLKENSIHESIEANKVCDNMNEELIVNSTEPHQVFVRINGDTTNKSFKVTNCNSKVEETRENGIDGLMDVDQYSVLEEQNDTAKIKLTNSLNNYCQEPVIEEIVQENANVTIDNSFVSNNDTREDVEASINEINSSATLQSNGDKLAGPVEEIIDADGESNWRKHPVVLADVTPTTSDEVNYTDQALHCSQSKKAKLFARLLKSHETQWQMNSIKSRDYFSKFDNVCSQKTIVISSPEETHLPRNIFLNKNQYEINLKTVSSKKRIASRSPSPLTDTEVNDASVRRLQNTYFTPTNNPSSFSMNSNSYSRQQWYFKSYYNNPFQSFYYHRRFFFNHPGQFQRPFFPQFNYQFPNYFNQARSQNTRNPFNNVFGNLNSDPKPDNGDSRKRTRESMESQRRFQHYLAIKRLARRLKGMSNGRMTNANKENLASLERLIKSFNIRYSAKLFLDECMELKGDEGDYVTIDLDEDDKPKESSNDSSLEDKRDNDYNTLYKNIEDLAQKLKERESKGIATMSDRRTFLNLIKNFNKRYGTDLYMSETFEIKDKFHVVLDSSDSDCFIEEDSRKAKRKKVINPFSIANIDKESSTFKKLINASLNVEKSKEYDSSTVKTFQTWLPEIESFGSAEVSKGNSNVRLIETHKEECLFDFLHSCKNAEFHNWLDLKLAYLDTIEEQTKIKLNEMKEKENKLIDCVSECDVKPLVNPQDCKNIETVLEKLRVIKTHEIKSENCDLKVTFDVYERDVKNFRKSNPPTPAFRIVCIEASTGLPPMDQVANLQMKDPNVPVVFAVNSSDAVSYIQMKPTSLPIYVRDTST